MLKDNSATELLAHPATLATSIVAAVGHALQIDLIVAITSTIYAQIATLFTALSISGLTLAPRVGWLPEGPLTAAAIVAGGLYVVKLLDGVVERIKMRL